MEYIAEIGWNFMGDLSLADEMIEAASKAGAHVAKFQYWNPNKLKKGPWDEDGRKEIYFKAQLTDEKIAALHELCGKHGVEFLMSVFNAEDAEFVSKVSKEAIKIPSHEIANLELIEFCLAEFKKVYISAGACTVEELDKVAELVNSTRPEDQNVIVMHCVSSYPCGVERMNLGRIDALRERFANRLGLSDHSTSTLVPAFAVIKGVEVIEKHFTTDHDLPGRDNKFAVLPEDFKALVENCEEARKSVIDLGVAAQDIEMDTMNNYRGRWG